jgi:hypothetical protein
MAELGETSDPRVLVPGDPSAIVASARALRARGDALLQAGTGLQRIDTAGGWSGAAADAFRAKFAGQPGKWLEAGDCFHTAAATLDSYSATLTWGQGQAAEAITRWNAGQDATRTAQTQYEQYQRAGGTEPFVDPGEAGRRSAQQLLDTARQTVDAAGDRAAGTVGTVRDRAPRKPSFWSKVGTFLSGVGAGLENAGGHVVNGLASFGNAVVHHPGDVGVMAAGAGLMLLGGAGDVSGGLLDATGVGALAGVPLNVVSTAAVAAGGGMVAAATGDLTMHAMSDDSTSPARTDHTGSGGGDDYVPEEGFRGSEYTKDEYVEFINGHTGDADPTMPRPTPAQVDEALNKGTPQKLDGQNAELFRYGDVKVILNYDMPWRSTAYTVDKG